MGYTFARARKSSFPFSFADFGGKKVEHHSVLFAASLQVKASYYVFSHCVILILFLRLIFNLFHLLFPSSLCPPSLCPLHMLPFLRRWLECSSNVMCENYRLNTFWLPMTKRLFLSFFSSTSSVLGGSFFALSASWCCEGGSLHTVTSQEGRKHWQLQICMLYCATFCTTSYNAHNSMITRRIS